MVLHLFFMTAWNKSLNDRAVVTQTRQYKFEHSHIKSFCDLSMNLVLQFQFCENRFVLLEAFTIHYGKCLSCSFFSIQWDLFLRNYNMVANLRLTKTHVCSLCARLFEVVTLTSLCLYCQVVRTQPSRLSRVKRFAASQEELRISIAFAVFSIVILCGQLILFNTFNSSLHSAGKSMVVNIKFLRNIYHNYSWIFTK